MPAGAQEGHMTFVSPSVQSVRILIEPGSGKNQNDLEFVDASVVLAPIGQGLWHREDDQS
jgi:hypothetical protein